MKASLIYRRNIMARVLTYECDECGCTITVNETSDTELEPIYCCGIEVAEVSAVQKKPAAKVKKTAKKGTKKITSQMKPAAKKTLKKSK